MKTVLVAALAWLGFTSLLAAASADATWLMAMRFFSGLSLGALPPLIIAYLTALAPPRFRGVYIFWTCAFGFLAGPAAVFSIRWLTPLHPWGVEGWRWPFAGAALMALGASAVLFYLPESPQIPFGGASGTADLSPRLSQGPLGDGFDPSVTKQRSRKSFSITARLHGPVTSIWPPTRCINESAPTEHRYSRQKAEEFRNMPARAAARLRP